jgi:hypothetical protein
MEVANNESEGFVEGCLKGMGFIEQPLRDWILIPIPSICKTYWFQCATNGFPVAKDTTLSRFLRIDLRGCGRGYERNRHE